MNSFLQLYLRTSLIFPFSLNSYISLDCETCLYKIFCYGRPWQVFCLFKTVTLCLLSSVMTLFLLGCQIQYMYAKEKGGRIQSLWWSICQMCSWLCKGLGSFSSKIEIVRAGRLPIGYLPFSLTTPLRKRVSETPTGEHSSE